MDEYKTINVHLFRPAFKNVKQRCEVLSCNACDSCDMYKQGKCVVKEYLFNDIRCPHGKIYKEEGYTNRARSYYSWFDKKKKKYGDLVDALKFDDNKICVVGGDYVYLPMSHLCTYVNKVEGVINNHFIRLEDFVADKIKEIVDFIPLTLMERASITDYNNKEISKFLQQLKEVMPELYEEFFSKYPKYKEKLQYKINNYIGRTAYINTMTEGSVLNDCGDKWIIEGEWLVCKKIKSSSIPFTVYNDTTEVRVKITDKMTYKITDNSQVDENTLFVD